MTYTELLRVIHDSEPIKLVKQINGVFAEVYLIDEKYYDGNGIEFEKEEIK